MGPSLHGILIDLFKDPRSGRTDKELGYMFSIGVLTMASLVPFLITTFSVKEKSEEEQKRRRKNIPKVPLLKGLKAMLKNKAFLCVMLVYFFSQVALQFIQNNLLLYCKYVINLESWFAYFLLCFLSLSALSLPLWSFVAKRWEKKNSYVIGGVLLVGALSSLFFLPSSDPNKVIFFFFFF